MFRMANIGTSEVLKVAFPQMCDGRELFPDFILWPDDATFKYSGSVNGYNFLYWATENTNATEEQTVMIVISSGI
jgi:hypothetical protein